MTRRLVLIVFALALACQAALAGRLWSEAVAQTAGPGLAEHLLMHAAGEPHHHHDGGVHRDVSKASAQHQAQIDLGTTPLALPQAAGATLPQGLPHTVPAPPVASLHPAPYLDGPMRPPTAAA